MNNRAITMQRLLIDPSKTSLKNGSRRRSKFFLLITVEIFFGGKLDREGRCPLLFWVEFGRICFVDISVALRYFDKLFSWAILLAQGALDPHFTCHFRASRFWPKKELSQKELSEKATVNSFKEQNLFVVGTND